MTSKDSQMYVFLFQGRGCGCGCGCGCRCGNHKNSHFDNSYAFMEKLYMKKAAL